MSLLPQCKRTLIRLEFSFRPQLLVLCKLTEDHQPKYRRVFSLASQLKAGKGLTVMAAVIPGIYAEQADGAHQTKEVKKRQIPPVLISH